MENGVTKKAEELGLDVRITQALLEKYFQAAADDIAVMEESYLDRDSEKTYNAAHNIKGTSLNLDLKDMYENAAAIENYCGRAEWEKIGVLLDDIKNALNTAAALYNGNGLYGKE